MSSDDGWVIRKDGGEYVLQHYFASAESYPPVEDGALRFPTLQEAVLVYAAQEKASADFPSEYGLTIAIKEEKAGSMKVEQFYRKSFPVEAVQVTAENMAEVAEWCGGEIQQEDGGTSSYIKVNVVHPLNEKQTKAYVGNWVLFAGKGYKVYNQAGFSKAFSQAIPSESDEKVTNVFEGSNQIASSFQHGASSNPGRTNSV